MTFFAFFKIVEALMGNRVSAEVELEGLDIPEVLLSGHHAEVRKWRQAQRETTTRERRPDLWARRLANQQAKGE